MKLKDLKIDKSYVISMSDFLKNFVGIDSKELESAKHRELKYFNLTTTVPFEVLTKEQIYTGEYILVRDSANNIAPYVNPNRQKKEGKTK